MQQYSRAICRDMWVSVTFPILGMMGVILFHSGIYVPIWLSVTVFAGVSAYMGWQLRRKRVGLLMLLIWVTYALPFIHITGYLGYDFAEASREKVHAFWVFFPNEYMTNEVIIEIMSMLGAVGALAFCSGVHLNSVFKRAKISLEIKNPDIGVMSGPVFFTCLAAAIFLSWIKAPKDTILAARYATSSYVSQNWNFSSAWMISSCLFVLCFVDALYDHANARRRRKMFSTIAGASFVLMWLNLARGDREALTMAFALIFIYFYWGKNLTVRPRRAVRRSLRWRGFVFLGGALFYAQMVVSTIRDYAAGLSLGQTWQLVSQLFAEGKLGLFSAFQGTWSAVLATPLSVAGDYYLNILPIRYGRSYLDLVLSLIPGFVADWIGYTRPLDNQGDLAWKMTYGIGGIHAVVMPFYDFRMVGVFCVILIWSYLLARLEYRPLSFNTITLFGMIVVAAPWWLWYGEKSIINAVIIWWLLTGLHRVSTLIPSPVVPRIARKMQTLGTNPSMCNV